MKSFPKMGNYFTAFRSNYFFTCKYLFAIFLKKKEIITIQQQCVLLSRAMTGTLQFGHYCENHFTTQWKIRS